MKNITRTIFGANIQTSLLLGQPYTPVPYSTLNEKFNVFPGATPANSEIPRIRHVAIGIGGHRYLTGADGQPYPDVVQHDPSDAALYRHVPFLIREAGDDIDAGTRARYAMRREFTVNGTNYIGYYLRRLDTDAVDIQMRYVHVVDGVETTSEFVPNNSNLNPIPPALPPAGANTTSGDYLSTSAILRFDYSARDVDELLNVCRILFNNEALAVISEIALVASVDEVRTVNSGGTQFNYMEAIAATCTSFLATNFPVAFNTRGFNYALEIGAVEPLLAINTGL